MGKEKIKKYKPVIIVLAAPLLFIAGVVFYLQLVAGDIVSDYDFIFTYYSNGYQFKDGQLIRDEDWEGSRWYDDALYRYIMEEGRVEEVDLEQVEEMKLIKEDVSPDGYKVETRRPEFTLFGSDSNFYLYDTEAEKSKKINIDYSYSFTHLGWVIED